MHWASVSFDWNQVRAFLATVEEGSLSGAARALGQTQPTMGRQVAALEEELGVALFERVGKTLVLTPSGRELLEHVRAMGEAALRISLTASGQSQTVEGKIRITASDVISAYVLPPVIMRLREAAPRLEIDLVASNDIRDLQRREADIALRHVRPEQPELFARLVQEAGGRFYAASSYLDRMGRPETIQDLERHEFVSFGDTGRMIEWVRPLGLKLTHDNFHLGSENGIVAWEMVKAGLGVCMMSDFVAEATPGIEKAVPGMEPVTFPIWLVTHRELHTSRRIRIVFDLLADFLTRECV